MAFPSMKNIGEAQPAILLLTAAVFVSWNGAWALPVATFLGLQLVVALLALPKQLFHRSYQSVRFVGRTTAVAEDSARKPGPAVRRNHLRLVV
jgi:uncharacterized membrane protein